jgi:hypothetical protein
MSLRYEQYSALLKSKELLLDIMNPLTTPQSKEELTNRAYRAMRHFPALTENGQPIFSTDPFTKDDIPVNNSIDILQTIKTYASKNIFIEVLAYGYKLEDVGICWRGYVYWRENDKWMEEDCGCYPEWEDAFKSAVKLISDWILFKK